jgi:acetolactate synthase I/II/III large subunit
MNGAEYIAEFLNQRNCKNIFLITGGAAAFMVDAVGQHSELKYTCFHHEQAAAMAADAVWRVKRDTSKLNNGNVEIGVTITTSGPGATNLITGIACSYFDSIPTLHITGQVNQNEKINYQGTNVRQAGFQETKICEMVKPITKYSVQVTTTEELKIELCKCYNEAISGRMGPVLIDVPMDVQKAEVNGDIYYEPPSEKFIAHNEIVATLKKINDFFMHSKRPLILFGAGVGLAGAEENIVEWLVANDLPFVASWNGMTYFDHSLPNYLGDIGVYGNRGANYILQSCDRLLVLGSRLDNRQRSGNASDFAKNAKVLVVDIDNEELKKYARNEYECININLKDFSYLVDKVAILTLDYDWKNYLSEIKSTFFNDYSSSTASEHNTLSPYQIVEKINNLLDKNAIVVADDGANLCWVFQKFFRTEQIIFTAGGNSPMGYSLPASIGATLVDPKRQTVCFTGDGSMQMNIQELQTIVNHNLNIKIFILNNFGYGIIKQFQDLYFEGRYEATGKGYSQPDFLSVASAYGIKGYTINTLDDLKEEYINQIGPAVFDIILHPNTLIEPKLVMGKCLHEQYPYVSEEVKIKAERYIKGF